ncbi:hypothetical protein M899_1912 [Bacteriovorax sp. BSW11_IV]|uniref:hypothetical protein n=1 Tax=Bacteriovorax sp. BSW11_IV TaxID=1353529 RepID=UPI00038A47FF|nr:hypothetical protein [Bacteriovorax sp. BSW11_IV]EQC48496.1 hypothetical protein M899_1912 [Bacteriovorax sp. BSW11_IV]
MSQQLDYGDKSPLRLVKNAFGPSTKEVRAHELTQNWPWPSVSPHGPGSVAPSVIHVPKKEIDEFLSKVVKRYIRTIQKFGLSFFKESLFKRDYKKTSDEEFVHIFTQSVYAKFFCEKLDQKDRDTFFAFLNDRDTFYKVDMSHLANMETIEGIDLYPSTSLFKWEEGKIQLVAINMNNQVYTTRHRQWDIVKLLVLQGAAVRLLICEHPRAHFPIDSFVGVSQCLLNRESLLYRLLSPHFYMQLPLNFAVLYISKSVAHNNQNEIYTPFPCTKKGFLSSLKTSFSGIEGNSAYPAYRFRLTPDEIYGPYGDFLSLYWEVIFSFVCDLFKDISQAQRSEADVRAWAKELHFLIPGFPGPDEIIKGDTLERVVTSFIHNVTVEHSSDHYNYSSFARDQLPLRVRKALDDHHWSFEGSLSGEDYARHELATKMYFQTSTLISLTQVKYDFEASKQMKVSHFHHNLRELDRGLTPQLRFIPLAHIASSIQF